MADVFNPWQSPPTERTLQTSLASFDINNMEGPEDAPEPLAGDDEHSDAMAQALAVIQQQSDTIAQLMAMMGPKNG